MSFCTSLHNHATITTTATLVIPSLRRRSLSISITRRSWPLALWRRPSRHHTALILLRCNLCSSSLTHALAAADDSDVESLAVHISDLDDVDAGVVGRLQGGSRHVEQTSNGGRAEVLVRHVGHVSDRAVVAICID